MEKYNVNHVVKVSKALELFTSVLSAAVTIMGLRSCNCLHGKSRSGSQSTSRYGLNRSRSGSVVHTLKIIRIAIRFRSDPDRDPDIFVPCN